tara:strand:+ start:188 stop:679 length:492 start_codon:yes stop_codon:yes gene_type:complete
MPKIIKDAAVIDDSWQVPELETTSDLPEGQVLVSLEYWNANHGDIQENADRVGLVLEPTETPDKIEGDLKSIPVIAVRFPIFADGRGFSIGRLLRERYGYEGELRAVGAPIRDQLTYLSRVGFNAFQLAEHYDPEEALASLNDFSDSYQTAVDQPVPLFRRRS